MKFKQFFAPDTGSGSGGDAGNSGESDAAKQQAALDAKNAKDASDAAAAAAAEKAKTEGSESKLSDTEAKLLKDLMKHKDAAKEAKQQAEEAAKAKTALESRLRDLVGVDDLVQLEAKFAELKKTEEDQLKKAGDFDALKERLISEHKKEIERLSGGRNQEVGTLQKKLDDAEGAIRQLLVSNNFASSKYLADELVLSGAHAERLYGENFKVEDKEGRREVVAYLDGKPLVDGAGKSLSFDDALKEIISSDPHKDALFRPKAKPGAGSGLEGRSAELPKTDNARGVSRISKGLAAAQQKK